MKSQNIAEWTTREVESILHSVARYTRFVRSTKVILGVLIFILTAMILFYPLVHGDSSGVRIAFTSSAAKTGPSPTHMINAHYHGMDKDSQPYNVSAKTAKQRDVDTVDLDQVTGDITLKGGQWLSMSADSGVFAMKDHLLDLKGNVDMFDDEGYEFRTDTMHVDVAKKTGVTHDEVRGQGPLGKIHSVGAVIDGIAKTVTFTGPVQMTIYPAQDSQQTQGKKL